MDCGEVSIAQSYQLRDYYVAQMGGNRDLDKGGSDGGGKKWPHWGYILKAQFDRAVVGLDTGHEWKKGIKYNS